MFWWIALGIIVVALAVYAVRHRRNPANRLDQSEIRSARWTNEGKGFGSGGSF